MAPYKGKFLIYKNSHIKTFFKMILKRQTKELQKYKNISFIAGRDYTNL